MPTKQPQHSDFPSFLYAIPAGLALVVATVHDQVVISYSQVASWYSQLAGSYSEVVAS